MFQLFVRLFLPPKRIAFTYVGTLFLPQNESVSIMSALYFCPLKVTFVVITARKLFLPHFIRVFRYVGIISAPKTAVFPLFWLHFFPCCKQRRKDISTRQITTFYSIFYKFHMPEREVTTTFYKFHLPAREVTTASVQEAPG